MKEDAIKADMIVNDVMHRWPQTVPIFRLYTEACVGCSLGGFCTVTEAATEYGLSTPALLEKLQQCADEPPFEKET
jgi:hybrid cluster-associated redox disulfide protein